MPDDTYVLDLTVTGADLVTVNDDGLGSDTISVQGIYTKTVEISLCFSAVAGQTTRAGGYYYDQFDKIHQLLINGLIENATGSVGRDGLQGNELANRLYGEENLAGPGDADTIWGGAGNDTLHGGVGADELSGDGDDDLIFGEAGGDTLLGGSGRDTMEGGAGADSLDGGGEAGDMLSYAASDAGVQVALTFGGTALTLGGDAEGDQASGFSNLLGTEFRDLLNDADKATLADHANDNAFYGGGGGDSLKLGGGDDIGFGGKGSDQVWGEAGNDALFGNDGKDRLRGGLGQDTLTGGLGADRFEFCTWADSRADPVAQDIVTDFSNDQNDRIVLAAIDAMVGLSGNQSFHLIDSAFTGNKGELRLETQGSDLTVLGDVNGDGLADFAILLLGVASLTAADFIL